MKIVNLKAENIKRLKAVDITPTDNTVIISGKNGQGKTSVLDSILYALGGKDAMKQTPEPIRKGAKEASVVIDLGDYKVERTWNAEKGTTKLELYNKDNLKLHSPQSLLNDIVGKISFDPLEFAQMKPKEQKDLLLDVLGVAEEVARLQAEYSEKYSERRDIGRDAKNAEGRMNTIEVPGDAPKKPVSTAELAEKLEEAREHNQAIADLKTKHDLEISEVESIERQIKDLQAKLKLAKANVKEYAEELKKAKPKDVDSLREQMANADDLNRKYSLNQDYVEAKAEFEKLNGKYEELSDELKAILERKDNLINSAKVPVKGLNIDSDGVTYNDIPFTQLSAAEQLKVSLAVAMAMNPKLKVMRILDGSLLDSDNLAVIKDMAKDSDYQVWIERVEDNGMVGVVIEDGEVKNG